LDRKISRLRTLQYLIHVLSCAAVRLSNARAIADRSTEGPGVRWPVVWGAEAEVFTASATVLLSP
jgi:hypothetical protein